MSEKEEASTGFNYRPEPKNPFVRRMKSAIEHFIDETNPSGSQISDMVSSINREVGNRGVDLNDHKHPPVIDINGGIDYENSHELVGKVLDSHNENDLTLTDDDLSGLEPDSKDLSL